MKANVRLTVISSQLNVLLGVHNNPLRLIIRERRMIDDYSRKQTVVSSLYRPRRNSNWMEYEREWVGAQVKQADLEKSRLT